MGRMMVQGPLAVLRGENDGSLLLMPYSFQVFGTAVTQTRPAAGQAALTIGASATTQLQILLTDYVLGKVGADPAVADIYPDVAGLGGSILPGGGAGLGSTQYSVAHQFRGLLVTGLTLLYRVNTNPATSITPTFARTVFAAGAALPATTAPITLSGTPTVTNTANLYAFAMTFASGGVVLDGLPRGFVVGNNNALTADTLEVVFVTPASCTVDFFGAILTCAYGLL